jgi:hypothetical protein
MADTLDLKEVIKKGTKGATKKTVEVIVEPVPVPVVVEVPKKTPQEQTFADIIEITKDVFPEENIEVTQTNNLLSLVIYVPEIIIVNGQHKKHTITDLYTKLVFAVETSGTARITDLALRRGSITHGEYCYGYVHSHVSQSSSGTLQSYSNSVCLGSTPIATLRTLLQAKYSNKDYRNFLHMYKNWLSWESIEGAPYRYMDKIISSVSANIDYTIERVRSFEKMCTVLHKYLDVLEVDISDVDPKITAFKPAFMIVRQNKAFDDLVRESCTILGVIRGFTFEVQPQKVTADTITSLNKIATKFVFKGKIITPYIKMPETKEVKEDLSKLIPAPRIVEYLKSELEKLLTKTYNEQI